MSSGRLWIALSWLLLSWVGPALARPGGGQGYSGGGSVGHGFSPGSGHGGGGELLSLLFRLVFYYPQVGVPLLVVVCVWYVRTHRHEPEAWDSAGPRQPSHAGQGEALGRVHGDPFTELRALDSAFSRVVFEDFAYRLFATAYRARHDGRALAALAPYLSEASRQALACAAPPGPVTAVVVGSMTVRAVSVSSSQVDVALRFEANLTVGHVGTERTFYTLEEWRLRRAREARSKGPGHNVAFGCPNCGAPFTSTDQRRCEHCGEVVSDGRFDFQVHNCVSLRLDPRPPALTSDVEEHGTELQSVRAPDANEQWSALTAADPQQNEAAVQARLALIYGALNRAWSRRELAPARGYLSDGMFDYLGYWVQAYREQGLENRLEDMHITRSELVKVTRDPYFDALTLRLWATGKDCTVEVAGGAVVSGSAERERAYSEYWTLIRGSSVKGAPRADSNCPNCAAPLKISMAGVCEFCGAHITSGEFDWVLSKIEQDEAYQG